MTVNFKTHVLSTFVVLSVFFNLLIRSKDSCRYVMLKFEDHKLLALFVGPGRQILRHVASFCIPLKYTHKFKKKMYNDAYILLT